MKTYTKPELNTKAFAQFENVFTYCDKGNAGHGCIFEAPGNPGNEGKNCPVHPNQPSAHAAWGVQAGS